MGRDEEGEEVERLEGGELGEVCRTENDRWEISGEDGVVRYFGGKGCDRWERAMSRLKIENDRGKNEKEESDEDEVELPESGSCLPEMDLAQEVSTTPPAYSKLPGRNEKKKPNKNEKNKSVSEGAPEGACESDRSPRRLPPGAVPLPGMSGRSNADLVSPPPLPPPKNPFFCPLCNSANSRSALRCSECGSSDGFSGK